MCSNPCVLLLFITTLRYESKHKAMSTATSNTIIDVNNKLIISKVKFIYQFISLLYQQKIASYNEQFKDRVSRYQSGRILKNPERTDIYINVQNLVGCVKLTPGMTRWVLCVAQAFEEINNIKYKQCLVDHNRTCMNGLVTTVTSQEEMDAFYRMMQYVNHILKLDRKSSTYKEMLCRLNIIGTDFIQQKSHWLVGAQRPILPRKRRNSKA